VTKVVIIGAGAGGRALLEMFTSDPTVAILGIADVNPWAPVSSWHASSASRWPLMKGRLHRPSIR